MDDRELRTNHPTIDEKRRPDLTCQFCIPDRLKTHATVIGHWGHIVNEHQEVANNARLAQIIRSALLWAIYWDLNPPGGKRNNPTLLKIEQTQQQGFSWLDVIAWSIR